MTAKTCASILLLVALASRAVSPLMAQTAGQPEQGTLIGITAPGAQAGTNRPSQAEAPVIGTGAQTAVPYGALGTPDKSPASTGDGFLGPRRLGIFTLTQGGTAGAYFDDNVFATHTMRRSDVAFFARPELSAVAQGTDYGLQASAFVEGRKYVTYGSEDQLNAGAALAGVYQPDADTQIRARGQYLHGHEDRGAGESVFATLARPVTFDQFDAAAAINKRFGRWFTSVGASAVGIVYQNDSLLGVPVDETYRNVLIPALTTRVGYVIAPLTSLFVEATVNARDFHYQPLTSAGYRGVAGLLFEPGHGARVKGEVFAGYIHQNYSGATLRTVSTFTYGGAIGFLVTDTLTLTGEGRREAKESGLFGGISLIESSAGARFDYQLMQNLVVSAGATYLVDEFQGLGRADRYISPLAAARYTINKNVSLGLDYRRLDYGANIVPDVSFRRNVILASVNARF